MYYIFSASERNMKTTSNTKTNIFSIKVIFNYEKATFVSCDILVGLNYK